MKTLKVYPIISIDDTPIRVEREENKVVDCNIVTALDVLLNSWLGRMNLSNLTMTDSLNASRMKDLIREFNKRPDEGKTNFTMDDSDYTYWAGIIDTGAPKVFGLNAIKIKNAFDDLEQG